MDDVDRPLSHLLPTVASPYPALLVNTASAIRDYSRSKIPLRAEEEPSRLWLASWIAAERFPFPIPFFPTNSRLATSLNLPPPKLLKHAPITIPQKSFKRLLGTFRTSIPQDLISAPRRTETKPKPTDVSREVTQLCTKVESSVSQEYLLKTLNALLDLNRIRESLHVIIAATFLMVSSWKDGSRKKITANERKKVIEAFDERFSNKELNDWSRIIEEELDEIKWFEKHPATMIVERKRKAENDIRRVKLVKNTSGVGIMVWFYGVLLI